MDFRVSVLDRGVALYASVVRRSSSDNNIYWTLPRVTQQQEQFTFPFNASGLLFMLSRMDPARDVFEKGRESILCCRAEREALRLRNHRNDAAGDR